MPKAPRENEEYRTSDPYHSGLTVRGVFEIWLAAAQKKTKPESYQVYLNIINRHILPEIGDVEVDQLTVADINAFLEDLLKNGRLKREGGLSPKSVNNIKWLLNSALKMVEWGGNASPEKEGFVKSPHKEHGQDTLTVDQTELLVQYLMDHPTRSNVGFLLCLFTGMRLSEICALKVSDFDFENHLVRIRRTLQRVTLRKDGGGNRSFTVDYGEGGSDNRDLVLSVQLTVLSVYATRNCRKNDFFLTASAQAPCSTRDYRDVFQKVVADAGLTEKIDFHMLRHTFALMWMLRYHDLPGLSKALGHATIEETQKRYANILEGVEITRLICTKYLCSNVPDK